MGASRVRKGSRGNRANRVGRINGGWRKPCGFLAVAAWFVVTGKGVGKRPDHHRVRLAVEIPLDGFWIQPFGSEDFVGEAIGVGRRIFQEFETCFGRQAETQPPTEVIQQSLRLFGVQHGG